ncbi:MAG TPA: SDR family oxidoreductase [Polyangiaceae bacterium]|jgi:NAD(P)-dependent dehydrogenase (short-subunit alcohol dehydrogenase family)
MTQSIFITGAASGIGKATAKLFASRGWLVGIFDVDDKGLDALEAELGKEHCVRGRLDVTSEAGWRDAVAVFGKKTDGKMNALFNCAGILRMARFEELPPSESLAQMMVNVMGPIYGIYASLPMLEKTEGACIVNMSSASAIYGVPELAVYSATKFAVRALTEALDLEFRKKNIRVADIMPSYVATPMVQNQTYRAKTLKTMGVKLKAEDIAGYVWQAVTGKKVLHHLPRTDLKLFVRLAGFPSVARPMMKMFSKM